MKLAKKKTAKRTKFSSVATQYARDIVSGDIVACELVILACQRHVDDLSRKDLFYDVDEERRFLAFCQNMHHVQGPQRGKPFDPAPFQMFIAGSLICWKIKATGLRRFSKGLAELGRKNAKTFLAGSVIAWLMIQKNSTGAEFYSAATTLNQASRVYQYLEKILKSSPLLRREFEHKYSKMWCKRTGAFLQNLAADHHKLDGLMPLLALGDEVHEWKGRGLYDVLSSSFGSTIEGLFLLVTSAGFNQDGIWWEERSDAISILKGEAKDDSFFAYIATLDDAKEWDKPEMWIKANPGLGVTKSLEYMDKAVAAAKRSPGRKPGVMVKELNFPSKEAAHWVDQTTMDRNYSGPINENELIGRKCHAGLDLASTGDIAGYVLEFEGEGHGQKNDLLARLFIPESKVRERSELDQALYESWIEEGWMIVTPGTIIDYDIIKAQILADKEKFAIKGVGFDPWNATSLASDLESAGLEMLKFRQGRALSWCFLETENMLENGRFNHGGNPILVWMFKNCVVNHWQGIRWVDRNLSKKKIDGAIMTIIAVGRRISGSVKTSAKGSIYDNHELEEH